MRRFIGLSCIAGATLLAEVSLTRVLSVSLFHHIAFLVVSTALLGTGVAGVVISVSERLRKIEADTIAAVASLGFAIALPICFSLAQLVRVEPLSIAQDSGQLFRMALVYALYALPFFGSGIAVAGLLDRFAETAPKLYASDLVGAGIGSFLALAALAFLGGPGALFAASMFGALACALFGVRKIRVLGVVVLLIALLLAPFASSFMPLHISRTKTTIRGEPFADVLADPARTKHTAWNTMARIDLVEFTPQVKRLMIDAGVAAVRIPPEGWRPTPSDATLAYELRPGATVLIIGSGASWEVAEALTFGASEIDAVEINPLILEHVPSDFKAKKEVRHILDEGRSFLERQERQYDAIVMVHTISNAATSAGAMHLAEDYVLTLEAMNALIDHLSPKGLLFITRPEAQLPRLIATLRTALAAREEINTASVTDHLFAWSERAATTSFYSAILLSRTPFSRSDKTKVIERVRSRQGLRMVAVPGALPADPVIAGLLRGQPLDELESMAGTRLDPATDDRPFFHQRKRFRELTAGDWKKAFGAGKRARMALEDLPFAEISALAVLIETTIIGALILFLPLLIQRKKKSPIPISCRAATMVYYAGLGLGFMLTEIALVQRLGLLLGRPVLAFATVFAGLLIGAGLGSRISERVRHPQHATIVALVAALILAFLVPAVIKPFLGFGEVGRVLVGLVVVLPTGVILGMPFPLGLLQSQKAGPGIVPWAFAVNALASIAGTVLALILATELGFSGVLVVAGLCYAAARIAYPRLVP